MSTIKISQLPAATLPLSGAEFAPIVQSGVTKKAAVSALATMANVKAFGAVVTVLLMIPPLLMPH